MSKQNRHMTALEISYQNWIKTGKILSYIKLLLYNVYV